MHNIVLSVEFDRLVFLIEMQGFKHAKNMGGGYAAWLENGFVVKKREEEPLHV